MTVGLVIVSHSAQLAAGVAELAGQMAQGKTPIAAAGGAGEDTLGTSVDKIIAAIQSVSGSDGVLVLLDLGSAILSAEMALEMLDEDDQRGPIRLSFAPLVEGAVTAALEASLGRSLVEVQQAAEKTASVEQLRQLKPLNPVDDEPDLTVPEIVAPEMLSSLETQLTLTNPTGLHARPASLFVQTAARYQANIRAAGHGKEADATSVIGILSLGMRQGDIITLRASGLEAQEAIDALSELVRVNFHEAESEGSNATAVEASPSVSTQSDFTKIVRISPEEPWRGVTTSAGTAVGPALLYTSSASMLSTVPQRLISSEQVVIEQKRLREVLSSTAEKLRELASNLQGRVGRENAAIFEAQALMIQDVMVLEGVLHSIEAEHIDAAGALAKVGERLAQELEALADPLIAARASDMRDVIGQAIARIQGTAAQSTLRDLRHPAILIASDLTPSDTAQLSSELVLGICTIQGGPTAHAAILARALGIPALAGLDEAVLWTIRTGDELGLDADNGLLYHHLTSNVRASLIERSVERQQQHATFKLAAQEEQTTLILGGRPIHLFANIGNEAEAQAAREWGAQGVGLLRTEFLFAGLSALPDEDEQRQIYIRVFQNFNGDSGKSASEDHPRKPIVVRTLDAGADKPMPALAGLLNQSEMNPALGLRGIRIHLAHQKLLEQQLAALLLAAADTGSQLQIMFPMITTVEELRTARSIFERVHQQLKDRRISVPSAVPIGIMVEVPAAVVMASELAELADFFSIGANDLSQYTLAADRTNASVADLYHPFQPAVLRQIQQVARAGREAGKLVAVCGELAGNVRLAPLLVGLGVDELSMIPTTIPQVRAALVSRTDQELGQFAEKVLRCKTVAEVEQALQM
jgi:phosphoenolpyruvate-protein phosphotransferase/dihydroxyacetone kinase phosphotransfer subunit